MGGGRGGLPDTNRGVWAVHFRSDIRKVGGGGGGGGGGGRFASGPLRKVGGGGGSDVSSPIDPLKPQKLRKPGPAPHKRTLTLLGGGGGGGSSEPPLATGLYFYVTEPRQTGSGKWSAIWKCPDSWQKITSTSPRSSCGKKSNATCDSLNITTSGAS